MNANCASAAPRTYERYVRRTVWSSIAPLLVICCGCPPAPPSQQEQGRGIPARWIRVDVTGESIGKDGFDQKDAEAIRATVPTAQSLVTESEVSGVVQAGELKTRAHLSRTGSEYLELLQDSMEVELTQGRFLTAEDEQSAAHVVVLDEALAVDLFPGEQPVGKSIHIGGQPLLVVGVLRTARHPFFDDIRRDAYLPERTFNTEDLDLESVTEADSNRIWVRVATHDALYATQEILRNLLRLRHPEMKFSVQ